VAIANDNKPRILFLDIETRPIVAEVWKLYGIDHIGLNQVREFGGTICVGMKWHGEKKCRFYSDWQHGHREMLQAVHREWEQAEAICGYNSDRFDLKKLKGEFVKEGIDPPSPVASIDVFKTVKREFGFDSNKLQHVADLLGVGSKLQHEGHALWTKVMRGDVKAQHIMERYCKQDVRLLERVYDKLLPWITTHPYLGKASGYCCNRCGSKNLTSQGEKRSKHFRIQSLRCSDCGGWRQGLRKRIA
jgi:uncharacterized protein YprB with RNaseH-like and TPR domain